MSSTFDRSSVLVTGASGFIGFQLTKALLDRGQSVTGLVRRLTGHSPEEQAERDRLDQLERRGVQIIFGDLTQPESFCPAIAGKSTVYHLAGCHRSLNRELFYRVNEAGTRALAECCAAQSSPPTLVFVSSMAAAGPSLADRARVESDPIAPVSEYGRSKRAGELAAQEFADRVPITVVRPSIVVGEGDRQSYPIFRSVARLGLHLVPTWRSHRYSVIHVADLTQLLIRAAERGQRLAPRGAGPEQATQGFYFAAGEEHPTYGDFGRLIGEALGRARTRVLRFGPMWLSIFSSAAELGARFRHRQGFLNYDKVREIRAGGWMCSAQAAMDQLGWSIAAPLHQRLRQTADWYREHGWI